MVNYLVFIFFLTLNNLCISLKMNSEKFLENEATRLITDNNFKNYAKSCLFITAKTEKSALVNLKIKSTDVIYSIGSHLNQFVLMTTNDFKILNANSKSITLAGNTLMANSLNVKGEVKFRDVSQWRLISHDSFSKNNTSLNWSHDKTTECNIHKILGGYCQTSNKQITKDYENIPDHRQLRVEANFHFLGNWDSDSGYLKFENPDSEKKSDNYLWVQRCKNQKSPLLNINLCSNIPTCKLASPISSTISHKGNKLRLIFGSSLEGNPCEQSFGISDVKIYIR
jgi:hypothetical protein